MVARQSPKLKDRVQFSTRPPNKVDIPIVRLYNKLYAAVTQLDRVPGYEPGSQEFESLQPRQLNIHMFRTGFYNDKACMVLIPKNASTAISTYIAWKPTDYKAINRRTYIAVFRDPVDRWISGATEYLWRGQNFDGLDITTVDLDRIHLDKHTAPQHTFIDMLDPKRTKLYPFGPDVLKQLQDDWNCFRSTAHINIVNTINTNESKIKVRDYVVANANFNKINDFYAKDLEIFRLTTST